MMTNKRTIWQDPIYEPDEAYEGAWEEYLKDNNLTPDDCPLNQFINDEAEAVLEAEQTNLNIEVPNGIVAIANLGLWNGNVRGSNKNYSTNIKDCLHSQCGGYMKFVVEDGEFVAYEAHHDGTNHYRFRKWKDGVTDEQKDEARTEDLDELTESLAPTIAKVYGW